jgi:hypothetical protein
LFSSEVWLVRDVLNIYMYSVCKWRPPLAYLETHTKKISLWIEQIHQRCIAD